MQYALTNRTKDSLMIMDANELYLLNSAMESENPDEYLKEEELDDAYEKSLVLKLVYGCYKPQPDRNMKIEDLEKEIEQFVGCWLVNIKEEKLSYVGIEDIEVVLEPIIRSCGHSHRNSETDDIAFCALLSCPEDFNIGDKKTQARTCFPRFFKQMGIISNIFNRPGVYCFKAEEKRIKKELTADNWKNFIRRNRALESAIACI